MHQGHNIPWGLFASNFEFVRNDKRFTPNITSLRTRGKPNVSQELKHFIRKFTQTIITFSETERKKYPPRFECPTTGNLFSDELRDRYPDYLDDRNQRIEHWIARAHRDPVTGQRSYGTQDARLADVVKVLLHENQLSTLLMLAHHPDIPIAHLHSLSWGNHFGFSRVKESAIRAYMFFNGAYATGILENGSYKELNEYKYLLMEVAVNMDFPAQQIPHVQFLTKCGLRITLADIYKVNPLFFGRWNPSNFRSQMPR
ncbi:hypothetical protein BYT27DRAFT_7187153 [Phlegmacium glaucopus]|nr:hypothetical protein BYT27DRAFT_7187153 [Phlegmacium glaucopus]